MIITQIFGDVLKDALWNGNNNVNIYLCSVGRRNATISTRKELNIRYENANDVY